MPAALARCTGPSNESCDGVSRMIRSGCCCTSWLYCWSCWPTSSVLPVVFTISCFTFLSWPKYFFREPTACTWKSLTSWFHETATVYGPGCEGFQFAQALFSTLTVDCGKFAYPPRASLWAASRLATTPSGSAGSLAPKLPQPDAGGL